MGMQSTQAVAEPEVAPENPRKALPFGIVLHAIPFVGAHILAVAGALYTGVTLELVALCAAAYFGRMFFITAGYHRYFAHRTYRTSRAFQFILALGGTTASQKGV